MAAIDTLITIGVLLGLFILAYCRLTGRTLVELFHEIIEIFQGSTEEVKI